MKAADEPNASAAAPIPPSPRYTITDLGTLPGGKFSAAYAINDAGQVVGWSGSSYDGPFHAMDNQAVLWQQGAISFLNVPAADHYSAGLAINNEGDILIGERLQEQSSVIFLESQVRPYALLWHQGTVTDLLLSNAEALNDRGQVTGEAVPSGQIYEHAYTWHGGKRTEVGPWDQHSSLALAGINSTGQIVGTRNDEVSQAFLYNAGKFIDLPMPLGFKQTDACGINSRGQIIFDAWPFVGAGTLPIHSFLWDKGILTDLGSNTYAHSINDSGQIVGDGGPGSGFLWQNGKLWDLRSLLPPASGWTFLSAQSINNHGLIVGWGLHNGQEHAFLLTPISDPLPVAADPAVTGSFIPDQTKVGLGQPLWVTFRIVNHSATPIRFEEANGRGSVQHYDYTFTALDAAGQVVSPPRPRVITVSGFTGGITVAPGETFQQRLFLPDWFTLHLPGSYTLTCSRNLGFSRLNSDGKPVGSYAYAPVASDIPLTILPSDRVALGKVIQALGDGTLAKDGTKRDEAALSLSVIPDERIIPIMASLLRRTDAHGKFDAENTKYFSIAGLSQFSSNAAADALLPALEHADDTFRNIAGNDLQTMKQTGRVLPLLEANLHSPSSLARITAIHALGSTQDLQAFAPLANALNDRLPSVRYEAAKSLGVLDDPRGMALLKARLQDPDMTLRLACVKGLATMKVPIQTQWLTPIVCSYAYPGHEYPSLEAMTMLRLECGDKAAVALASCLQFDDPSPLNGRNGFLILDLEFSSGGPKYYYKWKSGGDDPPEAAALENNRKILAAIKQWLLAHKT